MSRNKKWIALFAAVILSVTAFSGCSQIRFTTSVSDQYLMAVNNEKLTLQECNFIFLTCQSKYNHYYTELKYDDFWNSSINNTTFANYVKENEIKEELYALVMLDAMAKEKNLSLTQEEQDSCREAAKAYYASLNDLEREFTKGSESDVASLYEKYCLAQKMVSALTGNALLEISDNDKRIISLQILFTETKEQADAAYTEIQNGSDFTAVAQQYSQLSEIDYNISRGSLNPVIEEIAFKMSTDELSSPIQTDQGFYILKCVNDYDSELTESNEQVVYNNNLFQEWKSAIDEYASDHELLINTNLWDQITLYQTSAIDNAELFTIYDQYFPGNEVNE